MANLRDISFFSLLFSLMISSCATKKDTAFIEVETHQVEKSVGLDQLKFKKFTQGEKEELQKKSNSKNNPKTVSIEKEKGTLKSSFHRKKKRKDLKKGPKRKGEKKESFKKEETYPRKFYEYDSRSKKIWPLFSPLVLEGEEFVFKIDYIGITAGYIQMKTKPDTKIGGQEVYHFVGKMRSARYYSYIYSLDDSISSYVEKKNFLPLKYVLAQRESSQVVDDLQLFDHDERRTYHWYKRLKHGKRKDVKLSKYIPHYFQDSYSALHFVRGLPLKIGDEYEFPIVTRGKIWILKLRVQREESIKVKDEKVKALRISAETRFPGVLEKRGDILFWFSSDSLKKLLKFKAQVKIGSIGGELIEYHSGE